MCTRTSAPPHFFVDCFQIKFKQIILTNYCFFNKFIISNQIPSFHFTRVYLFKQANRHSSKWINQSISLLLLVQLISRLICFVNNHTSCSTYVTYQQPNIHTTNKSFKQNFINNSSRRFDVDLLFLVLYCSHRIIDFLASWKKLNRDLCQRFSFRKVIDRNKTRLVSEWSSLDFSKHGWGCWTTTAPVGPWGYRS